MKNFDLVGANFVMLEIRVVVGGVENRRQIPPLHRMLISDKGGSDLTTHLSLDDFVQMVPDFKDCFFEDLQRGAV
jgi:hypothetical protein